MPERVRFHFDPICLWCYETSRWARRLEELGVLEVDWGRPGVHVCDLDSCAQGMEWAAVERDLYRVKGLGLGMSQAIPSR